MTNATTTRSVSFGGGGGRDDGGAEGSTVAALGQYDQRVLQQAQPLMSLSIDSLKDDSMADLYNGWKSAALPPHEPRIPGYFEEEKPGGAPLDPVTVKVMRLIIQKLKEKPMVITFIAKKNYGKTVLAAMLAVQALLAGVIDDIIWMSKTAYASSAMRWLPKDNLIRGFNDELLKELMDFKQHMATAATDLGIDSEDLQAMRAAGVGHDLLVLDDLLGEGHVINNLQMKRVFSTHRHAVLSVLVLNQSAAFTVSPDVKQNTDVFFIGRNLHDENTKIRTILNFPGSERAFTEFVSRHTRVRGVMIAYNSFTIKTEFDEQWAIIRGPMFKIQNMIRVENSHSLDFLEPPESDDDEDDGDSSDFDIIG